MAATDSALRKKLLEKLGVTRQALEQRAKKRKDVLPMSTARAVYTIAHDEGIDISKYLSDEETAAVGELVSRLNGSGQPLPASAPRASRKARPAAPTEVKITIAGVDVGKIPGLSRAHATDVKRMSERVYPLLYIFENSVRDLIERVLEDAHGTDWWMNAVPKKVREAAAKHLDDEKKDPWHNPRGGRELDYVLLTHLWAIIQSRWTEFELFFPDQAWAQTLITRDMNVSRRVLAHMSPLAPDDVSLLEATFRKWTKQLKAIEAKLP
jgi:transcriptional regulator with XRE-family HTH domain